MIQALQILPEALTSTTDDINFSTIDIQTRSATCCGWLQYQRGSSNFTIIGGGTFDISFNANVTSTETGQIALALKTNGSDIEGTEVDTEVTTADTYHNVSFRKRIVLCPRVNTTISVGSLPAIGGVTDPVVETVIPTIKDANFIITRVS